MPPSPVITLLALSIAMLNLGALVYPVSGIVLRVLTGLGSLAIIILQVEQGNNEILVNGVSVDAEDLENAHIRVGSEGGNYIKAGKIKGGYLHAGNNYN